MIFSNQSILYREKITDSQRNNPIKVLHSHVKVDSISKRPTVKGKFIYVNGMKFYIRGITYGAFEPDVNGKEYMNLEKIEEDFSLMAKYGFNTVRIPHTTPPIHLLDIAQKYGLKVMISLSAEQYVGYLIDKRKKFDVEQLILDKIDLGKHHPALLCVSIGNEISASVVRWIGAKTIERFLKKIYLIVKKIDPNLIVTYVNYPTTEYLNLSFLDCLCFNVYLENKFNFESYLYKLQNLAGNRPLIMGEIGLDSMRNGEDKQATTLEWQLKSVFHAGCAGLFIFSWTDEWYRGEEEVHDWAFGLTSKTRKPKLALNVVNQTFSISPFFLENTPKFSIVVCTYNGARTIKECLAGLKNLNYNNYEVIVINDGSNDETLAIVSEFDFKVISTTNKGLSHARNLGLKMSTGEYIAYIDDDAFPDSNWLSYLAIEFIENDFAAVGGPNISPENSRFISECVNNAPGSPTHVLLSDRIAEHIPGCNMAFKREKILEIGGFDEQYKVAGDDVDVCWRIQESGGTIGFAPSAVVWHYRRNTIKGYWKQQYGYGKAEALLEKKWPKKYTDFGHRTWTGRIYGDGTTYLSSLRKSRIYSGIWGSAPFQSVYEIGKRDLLSFSLMPEWYLICMILILLSSFSVLLKPLEIMIPLSIIFMVLPMSIILPSVFNTDSRYIKNKGWFHKKMFQVITSWLYITQPLARLLGRMNSNLTPWRMYNKSYFSPALYRVKSVWCNNWISSDLRLESLENELKQLNLRVYRGGDFDRWDLKVNGGVFGGVRVLMAAEDHPRGTQYLRFKISPSVSIFSKYTILFLVFIAIIGTIDQAWIATSIFFGFILLLMSRIYLDCSAASGCLLKSIEKQKN